MFWALTAWQMVDGTASTSSSPCTSNCNTQALNQPFLQPIGVVDTLICGSAVRIQGGELFPLFLQLL